MNILSSYFNEDEFLQILAINPHIPTLEDDEVEQYIAFLQSKDCKEDTIRECLYQNPSALDNSLSELRELTEYLSSKGIDDFDELFYRNPFILSNSKKELKAYFDKNLSLGLSDENIIAKLLDGVQI